MASARQHRAARRYIETARSTQPARARGARVPGRTTGLSTAAKDRLPDRAFAFPKQRKEPLVDARHVRNAVARFGQVKGVSDAERDRAWRRIRAAARRFDVQISERGWRQLMAGRGARRR